MRALVRTTLLHRLPGHLLVLALGASTGLFALSCGDAPAQVTEPCAADCNEEASVGAACAEATHCASDMVCNLAFPGGYCQSSCEGEQAGAACGPEGAGLCLDGGETGCLGVCDPADPNSCGRQEASCYPLATAPDLGVCHIRCRFDADCGAGLGCDGAGVCRTLSSCDPMTDSGCGGQDVCLLSDGGQPYCGVAGAGREGESCLRGAGCGDGLVCASGRCALRCRPERPYDCGELGACQTVDASMGLGACAQP